MRIIVEGPDGAGKTTLIRGLKLTPVVHNGVLEDPFATYLSEVKCEALRGFDRFYPSEQVYGPVMRGIDLVGDNYHLLDEILIKQDTVIVICRPKKDIAFLNWKARHDKNDEYVTRSELWNRIFDGYDNIKTGLPVVNFDYIRHSFDECLSMIKAKLRRS